MRIAQLVLDACKRQVEKGRSLDGVNLDAIVYQVCEVEETTDVPATNKSRKNSLEKLMDRPIIGL